MDTVNTSRAIKTCVDEVHKHCVKRLIPDYQYASLVAALANAGKKFLRAHGEANEIAELVYDEIYGRGLERWMQGVTKAQPNGALTDGEFEEKLRDFDYMFRNGKERPKAKAGNGASVTGRRAKRANTD